jgi:hypothetical protein
MYGITAEQHLRTVREGVDLLEQHLAALDSAPTFATCVEAEFASMSLHDKLRDITVWLEGARLALNAAHCPRRTAN